MSNPNIGDLRVWWLTHLQAKPFHVSVQSLQEARQILDALANYDLFLNEIHIKPEYSNAGGLEAYEADNGEGSPGWSEWTDPDTGEDIDDLRTNVWRSA